MSKIIEDSVTPPVNSESVQDDITFYRFIIHGLPIGVFTVNSPIGKPPALPGYSKRFDRVR